MRRGTTKAKTDRLLEQMRQKVPGIAIRTTLITGYPGETEADFQLMAEWVREQRFERLGVFTYSHEEDTHAYQLEDDVPDTVKQERANTIMDIQRQISEEHNAALVGKKLSVLIDRAEGDYFVGRTEYDSPDVDNEVLVQAPFLRVGDFVPVEITAASEYDLYARPTEEQVPA
jgi:ribosomal protein S12 methylthiotransferase